MLFSVPKLISYISTYTTLHEGDMILTGTPEGVGPVVDGDYLNGKLKKGDIELASLFLKVEAEQLGA